MDKGGELRSMNKKLLSLLLLLMMLVPTVQACHWEPEPTPDPEPVEESTWKMEGRTIFVYHGPMFWWNGRWWVYNEPTIITEGKNTWVIFNPLT